MERLKLVVDTLGRIPLPDLADPHSDPRARAGTAFVEAYFTNFIEGTRFLVDKARRIVFEGEDTEGRPADGRDVTQTFAQVSRFTKGDKLAGRYEDFEDEIRERNRMLLSARPESAPGMFKEEPNQAGNTVFTMPHLVEGTLREAFAMLEGIRHPFARGLFTHTFLVLVHPFSDGNGRTARIMMTKELVAAGHCRVVVPTVFRNDYIGALRALSSHSGPTAAPIVKALLQCQATTSRIMDHDINRTIALWASTHAFLEDEQNARLTMPSADIPIAWRNGIPAPASYWADLDLEAQLSGENTAFRAFRT
jgi:Fic family protein